MIQPNTPWFNPDPAAHTKFDAAQAATLGKEALNGGRAKVILAFTPNPPPRWIAQSQMLPYVTDFSRVLAAAAPQDLKIKLDENLGRVKEIWARRGELAEAAGKNQLLVDGEPKTQSY